MDLVDHPDKESLSLQGFHREKKKKKKKAGVQIRLQKTAESKRYSEAMCFK